MEKHRYQVAQFPSYILGHGSRERASVQPSTFGDMYWMTKIRMVDADTLMTALTTEPAPVPLLIDTESDVEVA
eukprot:11101563-Prorocentrum_lima.AAC.1